ncbi:MAG: 3,4-dihydroxy-2-butanone-4-phosphate synthase, partial [Bacteroidota bacterium]
MSGNQPNEKKEVQLDSIEVAIQEIKAGKVIIVVDDEDRENEGDFICAADCITPEIINFMATHGRGLICTPIDEKRADELDLELMVSNNTALHETAFTVSIDLIGQGCTTGISARDRATGIKAMVDPQTKPADFARPGHIFPLRAKTGGVLRRTGHTEAAIDLSRMAGFSPAGVLVEILNEDGTMARLPQLLKIAEKHELKIISIKDLVAYRMRTERLIKRELTVNIDTQLGSFEVIAYTQITTGDTHLAIKKGDWENEDPVLVRVHSSTDSGDIMGVLFEDYGKQIQQSLEIISKEGKGLLLYMRHGEKGQ